MLTTNGPIFPPEFEDLLIELGLTSNEIRIYQFLLKSSSVLPSLIASATGESRGRIYTTMRRLVEKGFALEEATDPIQFSAIPLSKILSTAQVRFASHLERLRASEVLLLQIAENGKPVTSLNPMRTRDVRVLSGRRACHQEMRRMLGEAREFFWLSAGGAFPQRLLELRGLTHDALQAFARGVDVRVFVSPHPVNPQLRERLTFANNSFLFEALPEQSEPMLACVTETTALEVVVQPDDGAPNIGDDVGIYTTGSVLVRSAKERLRSSADAGHTVPFQWLGPNHGSDLFLEAVKQAKRDVIVIGPGDWSRYLTRSWHEMLEVYEAAKARGVNLRAVLLEPAGGKPLGVRFTNLWDIRTVSWVPVWLTVIDGQQVYQSFAPPSPADEPQFRQSREPNEIRFYEQVFESLWKTGTVMGAPPLKR